jgi:hypothetical protein
LAYVLFVRSLSPPKPAGLDPPNFRRHAPNWTWNHDCQKKIDKKFHGKVSEIISFEIIFGEKNFGDFFSNFFHENAERSVAFGELGKIQYVW